MYYGYSPRLPLTTTTTHYDLINDFRENIKQNFKNLVLTQPGERIMIPGFGVGLKRYLFDYDGDAAFQQASSRIREQVDTYMPSVTILDIVKADSMNNVDLQEKVGIIIFYLIVDLGINDQLQILL